MVLSPSAGFTFASTHKKSEAVGILIVGAAALPLLISAFDYKYFTHFEELPNRRTI